MARISITRLRLRKVLYLIPFIWYAQRSQAQALRAEGCFGAQVRRHQGAFWTLTSWRDQAAMRAFMLSGAHRTVMPKLVSWCDEASLAHWTQEGTELPPWSEGEKHLAASGRTSLVAYPSPAHAAGNPLGSSA